MTKKMLFLAIIIAMTMIGCSEKENIGPNKPIVDDPKGEVPTISFTITSTMLPLPANYIIDKYTAGAQILIYDKDGRDMGYGFSMQPGTTRIFSGDTAKLWLGRDMILGILFKTHDSRNPYAAQMGYCIPQQVFAKVEKNNVYAFIVGASD